MLLAAMVGSAGCLGPQQSFGSGDDDEDTGGDADGDTDTGSGSSTGDQWICPAYPAGTAGMTEGTMVANTLTFPGNDDTAIPYITSGDQAWSMHEFWCMGQQLENPKTVLLINVHSST